MRILENNFYLKTVYHFRYLFLVFALCSIQTQAQRQIDSLQTVLQNNLPDSSRIKVLVALSEQYEYVDVAKSRSFSEEAVTLAENTNLPKLKGNRL